MNHLTVCVVRARAPIQTLKWENPLLFQQKAIEITLLLIFFLEDISWLCVVLSFKTSTTVLVFNKFICMYMHICVHPHVCDMPNIEKWQIWELWDNESFLSEFSFGDFFS